MDDAPTRIYLQWHGDADPIEDGPVSEGDVTWSRDPVFDRDAAYIRADAFRICPRCAWQRFMREDESFLKCTRCDGDGIVAK